MSSATVRSHLFDTGYLVSNCKRPLSNSDSAPFNFVHPVPKRLAEKETSAAIPEKLQCRICLADIFHTNEFCECSLCRTVGCTLCLSLSERVALGECETACDKCIEIQSTASIRNISSEDSSDSDSSDAGLNFEHVAQLVSKAVTRKALSFCGDSCFQHKNSGTLHSQHIIKTERFTCGRIISASYRNLEGEPAFNWPRCSQCFGASLKEPV